jgi:hypothetical protein
MSFFLGEEAIINEPPKMPKTPDDLSEKLLAPGERDSVFRTTPKFIPYYLSLQGMSSNPTLRVKFSTIYRSINTQGRYKYQTDIIILEDCGKPEARQFKQVNDKLEKLSLSK